jgi:hypothetical protein
VKLRTLEQLEDAMDVEMSWRIKELLFVRFEARSAASAVQETHIRAGIALLYAHWEGFVKRSTTALLDHVAQRRIRYDQLSPSFLAAALKSQMTEIAESKAARPHNDFAYFLIADLGTEASFNTAALVRTESNLSSAVLRDITSRCAIPFGDFELRENLIDQRLVHARNQIAHGERYAIPSMTDFLDLHLEVAELLTDYRDRVLEVARDKTYLRL